jgi:hypothetical protein
MTDAAVAQVIEGFSPRTGVEVGDFARQVCAQADPATPERAKAFLFALCKLGSFAMSVGLELDPMVCLTPSSIERFIAVAGASMTSPTVRTLRSSLRCVAARVLVSTPTPVPLSRERAKAPYSAQQLAAYFSLAAHQPTLARRMRAQGLLALGAGSGLIGADLRCVKGTDVVARSGGVVVVVRGTRPRIVPMLARYHEALMASADFASDHYVVGGNDPYRHNVTTPLISSLAGGVDLPRLETARLRSTWLRDVAEVIGLRAFLDAAGVTCSQRLGDVVAAIASPSEADAVAVLGATCCTR